MTDSERITELKKYLGLNSKTLAEELGLKSAQVFYDIDKGRHGISKKLANSIMDRYPEISPAWLMSGEGDIVEKKESGKVVLDKDVMETIMSQQETIKLQAKVIDQQSATIQQLLEMQKGRDALEEGPVRCVGAHGA